jgi:hypothetical protein
MQQQCQRCKEQPGFHSFEFIADVSGNHYFYCFPAHNKESVRTYEDMLNFVSHFPVKEKWSLVFHAKNYGIQHMMPLSIALEMGRLVEEKYLVSLHRIYIVQGHWFMQFVLTCILPFLKKEMKEKFVLVNGSLLEVIHEFQHQGLSLQDLEPLRYRFE